MMRIERAYKEAREVYGKYLVATKDTTKLWKFELKKALEEDPARVTKIIDAVLKQAESGDVKAFMAIRDTIDGKPLQQTEVTGKNGERLFGETSTDEIKEQLKRVMSDPDVMRSLN